MDVLLLAEVDELRAGVVGVELDLVDGGDSLAGGVREELLQVLDGEVGNTNVPGAGATNLLHLLPCLDD